MKGIDVAAWRAPVLHDEVATTRANAVAAGDAPSAFSTTRCRALQYSSLDVLGVSGLRLMSAGRSSSRSEEDYGGREAVEASSLDIAEVDFVDPNPCVGEEVETMIWENEELQFRVVLNGEEQYSIWPVERELPAGWQDAGKTGTKSECLDYIGETWTDMRPLSVRRFLGE